MFISAAKPPKVGAVTRGVAVAATDLRQRAMAAAAALLGLAPAADAAETPKTWSWDTSFTHYHESDRISVNKPQIGVRRGFADERAMTILATVDTISGATPLGTVPLTQNTAPQTFTNASGNPVNPYIGKVPTTEMTDTRVALSAVYEQPHSQVSRGVYGGLIAREKDFISMGAQAAYHHDFNQKNTTLSFGVSPEYDIVRPNGGLPQAYGRQHTATEFNGSSDNKYLISGLLGVTQLINKRTLMQLNYSPTYENGYLNDPYKLISLVNAGGDPTSALHEKRPGSRFEHSIFWLTRYNVTKQDVFSLGLRYFTDDWGIRSQTLDFTYRIQRHPRRFFEPHVRYYHQKAAEFFRSMLPDTAPLPVSASADYRLNDIDGITFGLKVGWTLPNESLLIVRAEYYSQTGESRPPDAIGVQRNYDHFPTLHATILQIQYTFDPSMWWSR